MQNIVSIYRRVEIEDSLVIYFYQNVNFMKNYARHLNIKFITDSFISEFKAVLM